MKAATHYVTVGLDLWNFIAFLMHQTVAFSLILSPYRCLMLSSKSVTVDSVELQDTGSSCIEKTLHQWIVHKKQLHANFCLQAGQYN